MQIYRINMTYMNIYELINTNHNISQLYKFHKPRHVVPHSVATF